MFEVPLKYLQGTFGAKLGTRVAPHAATIAARLDDEDARLGELGEQHVAPIDVGAIVARLQDDSSAVRFAAVEALGKLGEHAAPHVRAIAPLFDHDDAGVRRAAVEALGRLGAPSIFKD